MHPWGIPGEGTPYILGSGGAARPHKPLPDMTKTLNEFFLTSFKTHVSKQKAKYIPQEWEDCKVIAWQ